MIIGHWRKLPKNCNKNCSRQIWYKSTGSMLCKIKVLNCTKSWKNEKVYKKDHFWPKRDENQHFRGIFIQFRKCILKTLCTNLMKKKSLLNLKTGVSEEKRCLFVGLAKKLTSDVWKLFMFYLALGWTWLWVICKLQLPTTVSISNSWKLQNRPNSNIIHT